MPLNPKKIIYLLLIFKITPQAAPKDSKNRQIMQNHLNKKKFISEDDHKQIINQFAVDPNSEEAQTLADLTKKNIEFLQEHYKGQNVEILPPKYQYFNKNKKGDVVPITKVEDITKAFEKKREKSVFIKSKSNLSEEIGKDLLRKSEELNRLSDPSFLKKKTEEKKLGFLKKNDLGKNLTFDKSLRDLKNSRFNMSSDLLKKKMNFKSVSEIKKNNDLQKPKKVEYEMIPHSKNLNFQIENDNLNLPKIDQRILKSTLNHQNSEFFKDHKIKKGNYVNFKKISEKDYLKSVSNNDQLQLIEKENENAIEMTNKLIEEEIRKAMEGDEYKPSANIPSLITGSDDFNERFEALKNNDKLDVEKDIKLREKKNVNKDMKNINKDLLKSFNIEKNIGKREKLKDTKNFINDFDKIDLKNVNFLEEDNKLQKELEDLNKNFERELELIEEQKRKRIAYLKNGSKRRENKENRLLEKERDYQKKMNQEKLKLKAQNLKKNERELEKLKLTMESNNRNLKMEIIKSEIYKKREQEIVNWKRKMALQKLQLEKQRKENKLREEQIKNLLKKKQQNNKSKINSEKQNLVLQIKYQKKINDLRKERMKMENDLKETNNLLMNDNKKLSTEDMKNFMDKIQTKISKIRKLKQEIKNFENLLQKILNENQKKKNKIFAGNFVKENLKTFGREEFPENLLLKSSSNVEVNGGVNEYLEDYPDDSVFEKNSFGNKALLMPNFGKDKYFS